MKKKSALLKHHQEERLQWAKNVMSLDDEWKQIIIFPDTKKYLLCHWTMSGNKLLYYLQLLLWYDLR